MYPARLESWSNVVCPTDGFSNRDNLYPSHSPVPYPPPADSNSHLRTHRWWWKNARPSARLKTSHNSARHKKWGPGPDIKIISSAPCTVEWPNGEGTPPAIPPHSPGDRGVVLGQRPNDHGLVPVAQRGDRKAQPWHFCQNGEPTV